MATGGHDDFELELYQEQVDYLPNEMLVYELNCRRVIPQPTLRRRRNQLALLLHNEQGIKPETYKPLITNEQNLAACDALCKTFMDDFDKCEPSVDCIEGMLIKLEFLLDRIERIEAGDNNKSALLKLHADCKMLFQTVGNTSTYKPQKKTMTNDNEHVDKLVVDDNIEVEGGLPSRHDLSEAFDRLNLNHTLIENSEVPHNILPLRSTLVSKDSRIKVPVWKWQLKFTGDTGSISASEFVRRAHELSLSRNVDEHELFLSAAELFDGTALKWFRSMSLSGSCKNWEQLSRRLLSDFEAPDYFEKLYDFIRDRKQLPSERIVAYFATMEDLFVKLNISIIEVDKVKIIKKNLLPEYVRALAAMSFSNVESLKTNCKFLEAGYLEAEKYSIARRPEPEAVVRNYRNIRPNVNMLDSQRYPPNRYQNRVTDYYENVNNNFNNNVNNNSNNNFNNNPNNNSNRYQRRSFNNRNHYPSNRNDSNYNRSSQHYHFNNEPNNHSNIGNYQQNAELRLNPNNPFSINSQNEIVNNTQQPEN